MKVWIETDEEYPSYIILRAPSSRYQQEIEIGMSTLERWVRIEREHQEMRNEISNLLDPPCPECGHPQSRHQEWSKGWDYWGCLASRCRCQHGKPEGR